MSDIEIAGDMRRTCGLVSRDVLWYASWVTPSDCASPHEPMLTPSMVKLQPPETPRKM
jgi:hypothetical protein